MNESITRHTTFIPLLMLLSKVKSNPAVSLSFRDFIAVGTGDMLPIAGGINAAA